MTWLKGKLHLTGGESEVLGALRNQHCPYGQVGDLIWVRERFVRTNDEKNCVFYADFRDKHGYHWHSIASDPTDVKWIPSIHMPKSLARIWLEITDIRCERLRDISRDDAKAEGVESDGYGWYDYLHSERRKSSAQQSFDTLWQSIYGAASWDANPYVFAIEFKRVTP